MDRRKFVVNTVLGAGGLTSSSYAKPDRRMAAGYMPVALTTATSTAPEPPQFLTWDGGSGPNRDYWSQKLLLPWINRGAGDWTDARLAPQGTLAFAAATVTGGVVALNVTNLVNRWISSGQNRGFYLRSNQAWAMTFAGRTHSTIQARPRLTVTTTSGTVVLDCSYNANWSPTSYLGKDSRPLFTVAQNVQFATLVFDLSKVVGTVQSAILSLNCLSLKYPGTLEVFELRPPEFRTGNANVSAKVGVTSLTAGGIASAYVMDRGIASNPSVIFAGDFSDLSNKRWQSGTVAAGSSQVVNPLTGSTYLRGLIPQGKLQGCDLERNVVSGTSTGLPAKAETELYARYYVYLEEDWGSELDANKMPGWDGRLGWWNAMGYWQGTTGNGGSRPTGLKVRNTSMNRWEYQGASMRGHAGTRSNDGNPYDNLFWIGNYIYHLDQTSDYGESINWPGVVLGKGRWYCIEQYIKMNSIMGPFDSVGNGVAVKDGQYRAWVDGNLAFERTNFRWRRHAEMGIQGFWLNWFHGGTAAAPRDMHFRMDSVVLARAYIGPRNESSV